MVVGFQLHQKAIPAAHFHVVMAQIHPVIMLVHPSQVLDFVHLNQEVCFRF